MPSILINYIEFKANNLDIIKNFYTTCFGWQFTDYGPTYTAFSESGIEGGFELNSEKSEQGEPTNIPTGNTTNSTNPTNPLVILYHEDLPTLQATIIKAGGKITTPTFRFPGGQRFHFSDPSNNELGVWSK